MNMMDWGFDVMRSDALSELDISRNEWIVGWSYLLSLIIV